MIKKDSIDNLLYQYAEKSLENKYNKEINESEKEIEFKNINMDMSFNDFWKKLNKNKTTIRRKKRKKVITAIVASLVFAVIVIGPNNIVTYADILYKKIIDVFKEGTNIKYIEDLSKNTDMKLQKIKYIPKGFYLEDEYKDISEGQLYYDALYLDENTDNFFNYHLSNIDNNNITLDTENAKTYEKRIDGKKAFIVEKKENIIILVEYDNYVYLLDGNIDLETLEKVFKSIFE